MLWGRPDRQVTEDERGARAAITPSQPEFQPPPASKQPAHTDYDTDTQLFLLLSCFSLGPTRLLPDNASTSLGGRAEKFPWQTSSINTTLISSSSEAPQTDSIPCSSPCFPVEHRLTHSLPGRSPSWSYSLLWRLDLCGSLSPALSENRLIREDCSNAESQALTPPPLLSSTLQLLKRQTLRVQSCFTVTCGS
ncbi:hypothetical protein FQA47_019012 [Oryzias melastigma]|uniref:Uncharacterized protein n=1 Tax=Oryzias melastigma TaxID=30732 RepID=A0A834FKM3_ORYME|nr:hypothetical protein FQA47_019012 [Oryzias melastigma]